MAWVTLRDALEMAAACGFDVDGDDGAATPSVSRKRTPTEAGAKFQEVRLLPAKEVYTDREMVIAPPNGLPRPAVIISLVVDNSGRDLAGRRDEVPAFRRNSWRERARELGIRLVG